MIHHALRFFKTQLNDYFRVKTGLNVDKLGYLDSTKLDPVTFDMDQVTLLLLHVEEERKIKKYPSSPQRADLHLYLYLIFICRFHDYEEAAKFLSLTIDFFQSNPVFDQQSYPNLDDSLDQLVPEMMTMPLIPKNEIWDLLKTSYLPSVLYKVKMLTFTKEADLAVPGVKRVEEIELDANSLQ